MISHKLILEEMQKQMHLEYELFKNPLSKENRNRFKRNLYSAVLSFSDGSKEKYNFWIDAHIVVTKETEAKEKKEVFSRAKAKAKRDGKDKPIDIIISNGY